MFFFDIGVVFKQENSSFLFSLRANIEERKACLTLKNLRVRPSVLMDGFTGQKYLSYICYIC